MAIRHDAFISYSHAVDGRLAPVFQRGIERLAKPLLRLRALDVFRDQTSLTATPALWPGIVSHLSASEWFLLFACPESAASRWCAREVQWWLDNRNTDRLLIVLTGGEVVWDEAGADFDWSRTTALPRSLSRRFADEPLYVDLRWVRQSASWGPEQAAFRDALILVAAPLRGMRRDELDGADLRQLRRNRFYVRGGVTAIAIAAAVATWQAVIADEQRTIAEQERDKAQKERVRAEEGERSASTERDRALAARAEAEEQRSIADDRRHEAEVQTGIAKEQRRRAEEALAATERELLRAQGAELRAMLRRVEGLIAAAHGKGANAGELEREREQLRARLAETTHRHQERLAKRMGFRGELAFLSRWEGATGGVRWTGSDVTIDPQTSLATTDAATLRKRYEFLLTPSEMDAVVALAGLRGEVARAAYESRRDVLDRIRLEPAEVARLVPEAAEPWWDAVLRALPGLKAADTPPSVHTALLSLTFNVGMRALRTPPLVEAVTARHWKQVADQIENYRMPTLSPAILNALKRRRAAEAGLIRAELAGAKPMPVAVAAAGPQPGIAAPPAMGRDAQGRSVRERLIRLVADELGLDTAAIDDDRTFQSLGADEIDRQQVLLAVEEAFDVEISDAEARGLQRMGDLVRVVTERLSAREASPVEPRQRRVPATAAAAAPTSSAGAPAADVVPTDQVLDLIARYEGFTPTPLGYGSLSTIGYSHRVSDAQRAAGEIVSGGETLSLAQPITQAQARRLLVADLQPIYRSIASRIVVPLTPYQRDSLASYLYSVGPRGLNEELVRALNAGDYDALPRLLLGSGRATAPDPHAARSRRQAEADLWSLRD